MRPWAKARMQWPVCVRYWLHD
jgi:hypothetical protein